MPHIRAIFFILASIFYLALERIVLTFKFYKWFQGADSTFSTSIIKHLDNYPLRQMPPLLKSTKPFPTTTKIHSAFCHFD